MPGANGEKDCSHTAIVAAVVAVLFLPVVLLFVRARIHFVFAVNLGCLHSVLLERRRRLSALRAACALRAVA